MVARRLLISCALLALASGRGVASTSDGSLITNIASATFQVVSGGAVVVAGYTVSYAATRTVLIQDPCLLLRKAANPTQQVPGSSVTFTVCIVNCSLTGSAFGVTITDQLPTNMTYLAPSYSSWGGLWVNSSSPDQVTWTAGEAPNGQAAPFYLRWVLPGVLGIGKSACITYAASVN